jgi:hypothetical protein
MDFDDYYVFMIDQICLQAKPTPEYVDIFVQYLLSDSFEAVVKLYSRDMVKLWKKVRTAIKAHPDYGRYRLYRLVRV